MHAARLDRDPATARFRLRLVDGGGGDGDGDGDGDGVTDICPTSASLLTTELVTEVRSGLDAFTAQEILRDSRSRAQMADVDAPVLTALVTGAGLGTGMIPASLQHELDLAVEIAATNLQSLLLRSAPTDRRSSTPP
ncbi:hypothetical protein [Streptomyces goshikiensis]|uniref:hypothetical protein n=1 Tax=Streptomyces goshikiensis TaxID=1942 RepID=UPI003698EAF7